MTTKGMVVAEEILDIPLDPADEKTFGVLLRAKTSVYGTTMATQAKVDENRLRRQTIDRLPALLKLVNEIEATCPPPVMIEN